MQLGDTIVAISSAVGEGAQRIIVRLSGPTAREILRLVLAVELESPGVSRRRLRFRVFPEIPCWIYAFANPHSVTGEDIIELHLPGNVLLANHLVDDLIRAGARQADPGEFTARSFFNGKVDLTEAEGVAAIVSAHSEAELSAARRLLAGELARRLTPIMESIARTLALVEAGIDFVDEGITFVADAEIARSVGESLLSLRELLSESARFERLSQQPRVVLTGRPNAGKSTLLNALAGFERAVVSPIAGTTRDALHTTVRLPRGLIQLIDAAGVDSLGSSDIEQQMHATALREIESADVVVLVHDSTDNRPPLDLPRKPDLIVASKSDLRVTDKFAVSAKTGAGLDELRRKLDEFCFSQPAGTGLALAARHVRAVGDAIDALDRASKVAAPEVLALELRESLDALGSILGQITPDDVLGKIFASFCIGK